MTEVVSDTSVVLKWFHEEGEDQVAEARMLLAAHRSRALKLRVLDLTRYELANALLRGRAGLGAGAVAEVLDALEVICRAIVPSSAQMTNAARLAAEHGLTIYDAAYAAVAADRPGSRLVSADAALTASGLALSPRSLVTELGLVD